MDSSILEEILIGECLYVKNYVGVSHTLKN